MKEIQRGDIKPSHFDKYLLTDKYTVFKEKMVYLRDIYKTPFPDGIFDTEELVDNDDRTKPRKEFMAGPQKF